MNIKILNVKVFKDLDLEEFEICEKKRKKDKKKKTEDNDGEEEEEEKEEPAQEVTQTI
jgi:hypothetical protein